MQFDASLLGPSLRRLGDLIAKIPGDVAVCWLGVGVLGLVADVAVRNVGGVAGGIWLVHGLVLTGVQIWITREALLAAGYHPALTIANILSLYLLGILVSLGILLGLLLLVLPGLYVAARWYVAGTVMVLDGGGTGAAIWRAWDLLERHWLTALIIGILMAALTVFPLLVDLSDAPDGGYAFARLLGLNLISAAGIVGGYLAAVAILLSVDPALSEYREIFS